MADHEFVPGRPIDRRSAAQRHRAARGIFGDVERKAARVVARYCGERVVIADDNSTDGMVDVEICYRGGSTGVLEITIDPAEAHSGLMNALVERNFDLGGGGVVARVWQLDVLPSCRAKDLAQQAPDLLARLEARCEVFEIYTPIDQIEAHPAEVRRLRKLGVGALCSGPAGDLAEPTIRAYPLPSGGPLLDRCDGFFDRLQDLLSNPRLSDVWKKLGSRPDADEHHLFLGTTLATDWAINHWLLDSEHRLPDRQSSLPPDIDHLWLWNIEFHGRVLGYAPTVGWFDPRSSWATS